MFFAWKQAGFKPVEIEIQPSQEIEDGWELEASEETEREAWAILPQDTVNFVAELAVAQDNESSIISGSPRENPEELPIEIPQVSDNNEAEFQIATYLTAPYSGVDFLSQLQEDSDQDSDIEFQSTTSVPSSIIRYNLYPFLNQSKCAFAIFSNNFIF